MQNSHQQLSNHFKTYVDISKNDFEAFINCLSPKKLKKNNFVYKCGDGNLPFIWIQSGYMMTYYTDLKGVDHVMQFGSDFWWTGDLNAILKGIPTRYSTKAITECTYFELTKSNYESLLISNPIFERYFRIIYQNSLISHQNRIINNISLNGGEKYEAFIKKFPKMELIVPQKYIASYLGITPEFLSMIKSKKIRDEKTT
jgi:CRP-like cAMP-binding protein